MSFLQANSIPPELLQGVISNYPVIVSRIDLMWGYIELNDYLSNLMVSDRNGRQGFPPEVFKQLMVISEAHKKAFPHLVDNSLQFTFA